MVAADSVLVGTVTRMTSAIWIAKRAVARGGVEGTFYSKGDAAEFIQQSCSTVCTEKLVASEPDVYEYTILAAVAPVIVDPSWTWELISNDKLNGFRLKLSPEAELVIDWGDGNQETIIGEGDTYIDTVHTYATSGEHEVVLYAPYASTLTYLAGRTGTENKNQFEGELPDYTKLSSLTYWDTSGGLLSGLVPDISGSPLLEYFSISNNNFEGTLPSLTSNTNLTSFFAEDCGITGYTQSAIATTCEFFYVRYNGLDVDSVDQILADLLVNAALRPPEGRAFLQGGTNAAPSAAGAADLAAFRALLPLFWVEVN